MPLTVPAKARNYTNLPLEPAVVAGTATSRVHGRRVVSPCGLAAWFSRVVYTQHQRSGRRINKLHFIYTQLATADLAAL